MQLAHTYSGTNGILPVFDRTTFLSAFNPLALLITTLPFHMSIKKACVPLHVT